MQNGIGYNFCRPMKAGSDLAPDETENTAPEKHLANQARTVLQIR